MVFQKMLPIWRVCDLPPADFADKSDRDQFWAEYPWNPRKYGAQQDEQYSAKKLWVHFNYSRELNVYAGIVQSRLDPVPATTEESENALLAVAQHIRKMPEWISELSRDRVRMGNVKICSHMEIDQLDSFMMNAWPSDAACIIFQHPRGHAGCKPQHEAMLLQEQMLRRLIDDTARQVASRQGMWAVLSDKDAKEYHEIKEAWYDAIQNELRNHSTWTSRYSRRPEPHAPSSQ